MTDRSKKEKNRIITTNREAYHNYQILETFEAGIQLTGTEVKSIRQGKINLKDAYARVEKGQAWLLNAHISHFSHGNRQNHDPIRERRLLLHKREIIKLLSMTQEKGLTIVPTKLYYKGSLIKCEMAVARGKKLFDKRETEKRRDQDREARAAIKNRASYDH